MKYIVQNAVKYGKPSEKAVIGKVIAENPELKSKIKDVIQTVRDCIREFESLSNEERKRLIEIYYVKPEKKEREIKLPPLEGAEKGKVVMRFAPNPNGPATLGSARGIVINSEYCKIYDGKFILRFDDTDPRTKRPMIEAYEWYIEDCEWLDAKPDEVIYASKRIPTYYKYCEELLETGKAYPCFCSKDEFKKYRENGVNCPHRNTSIEQALEVWERMLEGEYEEGQVVIRIKTDMKHKDPAIRDWVAFRIIYEEHPLVGDKFHVWPTLDFESAIEDHLLGITHIIRGKDLRDSELRQRYIYRYFGWEYPITKHWGRISIYEFGKLSTSELKEEIKLGKYKDWNDHRLPTLRALRRRGFRPEAIRRFFISLGIGENDLSISIKNLYAENRKIVDQMANRYFFVCDPVKIKIDGICKRISVKIPLNPRKDDYRVLNGADTVYISRDDFERLREGDVIRLKDFCNIRLKDKDRKIFEFEGFELKDAKKGRNIIHWLSDEDSVKCYIYGIERDYEGLAERNALNDIGNVVQFERFAFCRLESFKNDELIAVYTHP